MKPLPRGAGISFAFRKTGRCVQHICADSFAALSTGVQVLDFCNESLPLWPLWDYPGTHGDFNSFFWKYKWGSASFHVITCVLHVFLLSTWSNPLCVFNWIVWIPIIALWELFIYPKYKLLYIYISNIFAVCGLFFQVFLNQCLPNISYQPIIFSSLEGILGIIFKKPLTYGTGVMVQLVICLLCRVQSPQNLHKRAGHGGAHLQSRRRRRRDWQIPEGPHSQLA